MSEKNFSHNIDGLSGRHDKILFKFFPVIVNNSFKYAPNFVKFHGDKVQ